MSFNQDLATILKTTEKNVYVRAAAMRLFPFCLRCGGCGRYSFNGQHSVCYGCNGNGQRIPNSNADMQATLDRAREAVADGSLDVYLRRLAAIRNTKSARDKVMAAWRATGISEAYDWRVAAFDKNSHDRKVADINAKMCAAYDTVAELSFKAGVDPLDLEAAMNNALAQIEEAHEELRKCSRP